MAAYLNQKWEKLSSPFDKLKSRQLTRANTKIQSHSTEKTRSCSLWLKKIIPTIFFKKSTSEITCDQQISNLSAFVHLNRQNASSNACKYTSETNISQEKENIVPLRQFLRYSMNQEDQRTYQRRRVIRPFEPKYEIEWQANQWLQLDQSTCNQIERLRQNGFSKIAIRKDSSLKKYIKYDNPNEMDVLIELSLDNINHNYTNANNQPAPILCHQPSHFSVRRTHWWQTSYEIGQAHLPNWVDSDLCCSAVMMDEPSVLAAISNYSRSSLNSVQRLPDTPTVSQKSSMLDIDTYKPLKFTEPPFLMETTTIRL